MRIFFTLLYFIEALMANGQAPQTVTEGIIVTQTKVIAIGNEADSLKQTFFGQDGKRVEVLRPDDVKTFTSTTYFKNNLSKTITSLGSSNVHTYRNNGTQITSNYIQYTLNGTKVSTVIPNTTQPDTIMAAIHLPPPVVEKVSYSYNGTCIKITDAELQQMQELIDSAKLRQGLDTGANRPVVNIIYQDVTKEIAGYACKRAIIMLLYPHGVTEKITAWYNTAVKLEGLNATGDPAFAHGYLSPTPKWAALAGLKGFPMAFEIMLGPNRLATVTVKQLSLTRKVKNNDVVLSSRVKTFTLKEAANLALPTTNTRSFTILYRNGYLMPVTIVKAP